MPTYPYLIPVESINGLRNVEVVDDVQVPPGMLRIVAEDRVHAHPETAGWLTQVIASVRSGFTLDGPARTP